MSDGASEEAALRLKERGNAAYRENNFGEAVSLWGAALHMLDDKDSPLGIALRSNTTMVYMKMGQPELVIPECTEILEVDPQNTKALARRAAARERMAEERNSRATFEERKEHHNLAVEDLRRCIAVLEASALDPHKARLKRECQESLDRLSKYGDSHYLRLAEDTDGKTMASGLGEYLAMNMTPLPEHPRIPMSSLKEEILAVRLLAAMEIKSVNGQDCGTMERGREILNLILTAVAQVPFCLFPATGSNQRCPPITVHLLAFYMRACLSKKAKKEFGIEEFCKEATSRIITDAEAYAIATHGYREVEDMHSPMRGHGKSFGQSARGCMPCSFRLTREGKDDWGAGLQQSAHNGSIEGVAFILNRLIEKIDGGRLSVVDCILETDVAGCNSMMHAANDAKSGFAGLTIRMLIQAVSFSTPNVDEKELNVRLVLNTVDRHGFSPALASASLMNVPAMEAFVRVGARLYDTKVNEQISSQSRSMVESCLGMLEQAGPGVGNLARALKMASEDRACCSHCGNSPDNTLLKCSRCLLARYCNRDCQKKGYKQHKFVCTSAKVDENAEWYSSKISTPRP